MKTTTASLLCCLYFCLTACVQNQHSASLSELEQLAKLMEGRFDSMDADNPPDENRLVDSRARADQSDLGSVVFYLQLNRGPSLELYRQRILVISETDGQLLQRAYRLREPQLWHDAQPGDPRLASVNANDVELMFESGCQHVWRRIANGFEGHTDPSTCRIISGRTGEPRRIEAVSRLSSDELQLAERGFDDRMRQLFGSKPDQALRLTRVDR